MTEPYVVYGTKGSGSVPIEAALLLADAPYQLMQPAPPEQPGSGDISAAEMHRINPMRQVPAVILPSGELMTESAAILIHIAERHPEAGLAPTAGDPRRPAFLRWMAFLASQIYGLVWVRDDPRRLALDAAHEAVIMERTAERRLFCWRIMDAQLRPGRYLLGDDLTVLDLYATVLSSWGPGREPFREAAPRVAAVVERVDQHPRLAPLWAERLG